MHRASSTSPTLSGRETGPLSACCRSCTGPVRPWFEPPSTWPMGPLRMGDLPALMFPMLLAVHEQHRKADRIGPDVSRMDNTSTSAALIGGLGTTSAPELPSPGSTPSPVDLTRAPRNNRRYRQIGRALPIWLTAQPYAALFLPNSPNGVRATAYAIDDNSRFRGGVTCSASRRAKSTGSPAQTSHMPTPT
jgi:hypothetical protein